MHKLEVVQSVQYVGTIESYNQMVDAIYHDANRYQINFIDEKHEWTNKFTGSLSVVDLKTHEGMLIKPGDYYQIKDESKFIS